MNEAMKVFLLILGLIPMFVSAQQLTFLGTNEYSLKGRSVDARSIAREYGFEFAQYNLDGMKNLERSIAKGLPTDVEKAHAIANERLSKLDESETMELFVGPAYLVKWDIKKLPAFVFGNGEYVMYGVTDTNAAIKRYINSRKR